MNCEEIFNAAKVAAQIAIAGAQDGYPCGFAIINIRPARGAFVKFLKDNNIGYTGTYGGYTISSHNICNFQGQNVEVKNSACLAAAAILCANGINATVTSRLD